MKPFLILFILVAIMGFISCEDDIVTRPTDSCDTDIGDYLLLDANKNIIPYQNKSNVVFVDSLQSQLSFRITGGDLIVSEEYFFKYDVNVEGDTIKYCYRSESKGFTLENDSLEISFTTKVIAQPYYPDPESGRIADFLEVHYNNRLEKPFHWYIVFFNRLSQRTFPGITTGNIFFASIEFDGKTFINVEQSNFITPRVELFYNTTEGIVAFRDKTGNLWRFESF